MLGHLAVAVEVAREKHSIRAQSKSPRQRHGRAHAKSPGLIRGRGDNPAHARYELAFRPALRFLGQIAQALGAIWRVVYDHRLATQRRVVKLLHGSEECIHVDMKDPPPRGLAPQTRLNRTSPHLAASR